MKINKLSYVMPVILLVFIAGCGEAERDPAIDALAACLADKGVKEYGAFWCPNCAKQEKAFGPSYSILKERQAYIECDPRCDTAPEDLPNACKGMEGQPELCLSKGVDKYPAWEFPDGEMIFGVQSLETLAEKSGCTYK